MSTYERPPFSYTDLNNYVFGSCRGVVETNVEQRTIVFLSTFVQGFIQAYCFLAFDQHYFSSMITGTTFYLFTSGVDGQWAAVAERLAILISFAFGSWLSFKSKSFLNVFTTQLFMLIILLLIFMMETFFLPPTSLVFIIMFTISSAIVINRVQFTYMVCISGQSGNVKRIMKYIAEQKYNEQFYKHVGVVCCFVLGVTMCKIILVFKRRWIHWALILVQSFATVYAFKYKLHLYCRWYNDANLPEYMPISDLTLDDDNENERRALSAVFDDEDERRASTVIFDDEGERLASSAIFDDDD